MNLEDIIHKTPANVDPNPGELLVAAPMMTDPNFCRTAVLIIDRDEDGGHLGLVMNRELEITLDKVLKDWPNADRVNLYHGGPVDLERLFMLHTLGHKVKGSIEIMPGLYTGGDRYDLRECFATEDNLQNKIRFFVGYAGWSAGQLTSEILQNTWAINTNPDLTSLLRGEGFGYWDNMVRALGEDYKSWLNVPIHPSLN